MKGEREKDYNVTKNSLLHLQKGRRKFMRQFNTADATEAWRRVRLWHTSNGYTNLTLMSYLPFHKITLPIKEKRLKFPSSLKYRSKFKLIFCRFVDVTLITFSLSDRVLQWSPLRINIKTSHNLINTLSSAQPLYNYNTCSNHIILPLKSHYNPTQQTHIPSQQESH
jgi:hypothetical protein